jgi:hypothetical protein
LGYTYIYTHKDIYIYIEREKYHSETPCIAIPNKQKKFFLKIREKEGKTGPI